MSERMFRALVVVGSVVLSLAAAGASPWGGAISRGILVGGFWNLLNLWCLDRTLHVWLIESPSRKRSAAWFLVKFPLLYALAIGLLMTPGISPIGFGIGFAAILMSALMAIVVSLRGARGSISAHGR